jgi:hypothetical protein
MREAERRGSAWLSVAPPTMSMTANRDELIHLIEGMPDDQVEAMLADARRRAAKKPKGTSPPKFVGMIKDGPKDGSSPEYVDAVLARGFGLER